MTFEQLMSCHKNNPRTYKDLLEQLRLNNVTPFIGAGLTTWAGFPQWKNLLSDMAAEYGSSFQNKIKALLKDNKYEQAASEVQNEMGLVDFERSLEETFSDQKFKDNAEKRPAYQKWLPEIFKGIWVTTNFDRGIENLFDKQIDSLEPCDPYQEDRIESAMHNNSTLLLKMHGDIKNIKHLVLTKEGYDVAYANGQPMPRALKKVFERKSVLFLGYSLVSDRTTTVLEQCCENNSQFAVMQLPDDTLNSEDIFQPKLKDENGELMSEWKKRQKFLSDHNISCIWYPAVSKDYEGNIHNEALTALFEQLMKDLNINPSPRNSGKSIWDAESKDDIFLFRDDELKTVTDSISVAGAKCAVVGAPGIGKTALCEHVRKGIGEENFPYVRVEGVSSVRSFFDAVAKSVGQALPNTMDTESAGSAAFDMLRDRSVKAIYLDNFEDILYGTKDKREERNRLRKWLNVLADKGISCLISSREEPPVEYHAKAVTPSTFTDEESKEVFLEYLGREIASTEEADLDKLITQLGGLPLAIVLTAAQAREEINIRDLLNKWTTIKREMANQRHDSLAIACKVSWDYLQSTPNAQELWGVFAFGTGRMTTELIDWLGEPLQNGFGKAVNSIISASLVRRNADHTAIEMYVPIREQFFQLADKALVERAARIWFIKLIPCLDTANDSKNPDRLAAHYKTLDLLPDCLSILEHLCDHLPDHDWIAPLDVALLDYYQFALESRSTLTKLGVFYSKVGSEDISQYAYTLYIRGNLERCLGNVDTAKELYEEAEKLFCNAKHDLGLARTLRSRGDLESRLGNVDTAKELYEEAGKLFRNVKNDLDLANTLKSRGNLEGLLGNVDTAKELYEEAGKLFRNVKDDLGLAYTLQSRGDLERLLGNVDTAKELYEEAEKLFRNVKDDLGLAYTLQSRGDLERRLGNVDTAKELYEEAEKLFRNVKDDLGLANTLQSRGDLERRLGNVDTAKELYEEAEKLFRNVKNDLGLAYTLKSRGDLESRLGNVDTAKELYEKAEKLFRNVKVDLGLANTLQSRGNLILSQATDAEGYSAAKQEYLKALLLYKKEQEPMGMAYTCANLYLCHALLHETAEADAIREKALGLLEKVPENVAEYVRKALSILEANTKPHHRIFHKRGRRR